MRKKQALDEICVGPGLTPRAFALVLNSTCHFFSLLFAIPRRYKEEVEGGRGRACGENIFPANALVPKDSHSERVGEVGERDRQTRGGREATTLFKGA